MRGLLFIVVGLLSGPVAAHAVQFDHEWTRGEAFESETTPPRFFKHLYRLQWTADDLVRLKSLALDLSSEVRVEPAGAGEALGILIRADIQSEGHQELARELQNQILSASAGLDGDAPSVTIPERECNEETSGNRLIGFSGVCLREAVVRVPAEHPVAMELLHWKGAAWLGSETAYRRVRRGNDWVWEEVPGAPLVLTRLKSSLPEHAQLRLQNVKCPVEVEGGGEGTALMVQGISSGDFGSGRLTLRASRLQSARLNQVEGKILLFVDDFDSDRDRILVEGKAVCGFPWDSSSGPPTDDCRRSGPSELN